MTRYFYDTEFIEDGRTIALISIGIAAEDGREYYAVNSDLPIEHIRKDDWLLRNVVPSLPIVGEPSIERYINNPVNRHPRPSIESVDVDRKCVLVKPKWVIANEVRDFILGGEGEIELWADYAAYDHVALAQLFGKMISLPDGFPMFTHDLQQEAKRLGLTLPDQPAGNHNALEDARHNVVKWNSLRDPVVSAA